MTRPPPTPPASGRGVRAALNEATTALAATSETPRLDAELLMAHALGRTREQLLLGQLDGPTPPAFADLVARRLAHEPIAYITGTRAFWTIELQVGPGVLIPRPDSETLIEAAVAHFKHRPPATILDLGTGPGTLLLAALAEWPAAHGLGIDASEPALSYARRNAIALGLADRVRFQPGDWAAGLATQFDLILANPPYIGTTEPLPRDVAEHEPAAALYAGPDGLDEYRALIPQLRPRLTRGGAAILEIGSTQAVPVTTLLEAQGFTVAVAHDLAGHPRALIAT
ncbi:peptide chain release factor N(5)-glutamine methyltransferase [Sphingomonas sp. PB4P5]|uniref:peptide chain release factor N(5)-glutamine methyltransferase n=1 Tax=Parasphingomonas puruogangriensis TaxID=3096155 RepID=UPI002FCAB235